MSPLGQEMEERQDSSSRSSSAQAQAPLPTSTGLEAEFSTEDLRRCRVIHSSAYDPYVEDAAVIHKRDVSLVAFGAAHRHWTDSVKRYASDESRVKLGSDQHQERTNFIASLLPSLEPLWKYFKSQHNVVTTLIEATSGGAAGDDTPAANSRQQQETARFLKTIKTSTQPENYVQLFLRLREYSEFDFLRLILDTRGEAVLKAQVMADTTTK